MTGVVLLEGAGIGVLISVVIAAVVLWSEAGWNRVRGWRERRRG